MYYNGYNKSNTNIYIHIYSAVYALDFNINTSIESNFNS